MRGRHVSGCYSLLAVMCFLAAVSGSCSLNEPATEVMLVVEAETQAQMRGIELQVDIEGRNADEQPEGMPITRAFHPKEPGAATWPIELAITPRGGDASRSYSVTVTLFDSSGPIAVQRARSGFVAKKTLALHMVLTDDCLKPSLACSENEACLLGSCVDAFIDPNALASWPDGTGFGTAADGGIDDSTSSSMEPAVMSSAGGKGGSKTPANAGSGGPSKPGGSSMQGAGGMGGAGAMGEPDAPPQTEKPGDCGDGVINPGEKCDTGIPEGQKGSCPTACAGEDACHPATLEGDGCQSECKAYPIMTADSGDGCCPPGTDAKDDTDCGALCGNGVQEAGEKCDPAEMCPTVDKCQKADACYRAKIIGDATQCSAECMMEPIAECVAGDGCCPSNCTNANDSDCSSSCGDGVVNREAGELCEPNSATPCPTTCTDTDACTSDMLLGSEKNCNSVCTHVPILVPIPGDGCCPPGANANSDVDCKAMCGNGIVELGERCDGRCPTMADCNDGNACTVDKLEGSAASCDARCTHALINTADKTKSDMCCPRGGNANNDIDCKQVCGNGVKEGDEVCDGNDCPRCMDSDTDPCTVVERGGTNCKPTCTPMMITARVAGDGCCPSGAKMSDDADCKPDVPPPPTCPNGTPDPGEICDGNCPESCDDGKPCTKDVKKGTAAECNVECSHTEITTPADDGCCLPGENSSTESACTNPPPPTCPNGRPDPGETCDGNCPESCDDGKPCTKDTKKGTPAACNVECMHADITTPADDGCCLPGENSSTDKSCTNAPPAMCGNGKVEDRETCDGNCPPCTATGACTRAVPGGTECNPTCTIEEVANCCPPGQDQWQDPDCPAQCGNQHVETGEECDNPSQTCVNCQRVTGPPDPPADPDPPIAGSAAPVP